jgi:hypothetical protein
MGRNFKIFVLSDYFAFQGVQAHIMIQYGKEMLDLSFAGVIQASLSQQSVDFFLQSPFFLQDMLCLLKAAEATFAKNHDVESRFFSQGQVDRRRKEKRLLVRISHGITATIKFADIRQMYV